MLEEEIEKKTDQRKRIRIRNIIVQEIVDP